ncbi:MAG: hypothetical protein JWM12_2143 [Ilumatobacteraceae bacterium]|nr:hypothetical protein [Ilumatobacteraceae bacterium]
MAPSRRRRRILGLVFAGGCAAYLTWVVVAHRDELDRAVLRFRGAHLRWLIAAICLEVLSQAMSVLVQLRLLRRVGSTMSAFTTTRMVLAQNAIGLALPGGQAVAAGFSYGQIKRRGTKSAVATWVVAATTAIGMLALIAFGAFTATGWSWFSVSAGVALLGLLVLLATTVRNPDRLRGLAVRLVGTFDRLRRRRGEADAADRVDRRLEALRRVRLRWTDWLWLALFALAAVAADCAVWICASHAIIGIPAGCNGAVLSTELARQCAAFHAPTTGGLLIAYSAGQGALALPLVPGGVGLVESVMTTVLTTSKVRAIAALSAVLLYRLISFWTVVIIGGSMWLTMRRRTGQPSVAAGDRQETW